MKRLALAVAVAAACAFGFSGAAEAVGVGASFNITASVAPNCSVTANNVNLGSLTPGTSPAIAGSMSVSCTNTTPYAISMNGGMQSNQLTDGAGNFLSWSAFPASALGTGNGVAPDVIAINGNVTVPLSAIPGTYSDVVNLVVSY